jgi:predicted AlkP superfamily pyrophosphatase or phosphodiesterase
MKTMVTGLLALLLAGCAYPYTPPALAPVAARAPVIAAVPASAPVTILVSIDGFRPDYLDRGVTPRLSRLAADGVSASMRPSFPSKTFPNHWTLVTGLVPDHHGIVGNDMEDPARATAPFTLANDDPFWWNAAEPIWVAAEKAGIRTATMFWPGANLAWGSTAPKNNHGIVPGGTRPQDWADFNANISGQQRVDSVIDWLRRPAATRPRFVTLYFDTVDSAGHDEGPDGAGVTAALADVDRSIGRLVDGIAALGLTANLVIVADHGIAPTSSTRVIALDTIADPADYHTVETGPYATIASVPGHEAALAAALLKPHAHMRCWAKAQIPARLRYGANPRVPAYLCLAEDGWLVWKSAPTKPFTGGNHGYDNAQADMAALFIANGPAFARGKRIAPFDNVDVTPLLRDLIGLPAATGLDGDDAPFEKVRRP